MKCWNERKNMENILLSIIVPVYNTRDYLTTCIESILGQTYKYFEVILIDDGSTDGSASICDEYAKKDERIKVIHKNNEGIVSARKAGVELAQGRYILGVDADDWIDPNRFENVANTIETTNSDIIYSSGMTMEYTDKSIVVEPKLLFKTYVGDEIAQKIFPLWIDPTKCFSESTLYPALWLWTIKSNLLKSNINLVDDRVCRGEDLSIVWLSLLSAKTVTFIFNSTYHYRQRKESIMNASAFDYKERKIWYQNIKKQLSEHSAPDIVMKCLMVYMNLNFISYDYPALIRANKGLLYPYSNVKEKSNIIVYGAGKIGRYLVHSLIDSSLYNIVMWVDKNTCKPPINNYKVSSVDEIKKIKFDYIVVAVLSVSLAKEIRDMLMMLQIPKCKIAIMDAKALNENIVLEAFREGTLEGNVSGGDF